MRMNWNRWAAFFSLAGLAVFLPALVVPAMLVANAIDGPRWYSVWGGIREFYRQGDYFLASLIAGFSVAFPLLKFLLMLGCAAGRHRLPHQWRKRMVTFTAWTAKYSMLDVLVIAMLVLLVKVNEYVRILPSLGLYLFSAAILCSVLAGAALNRALVAGGNPDAGLSRRAFLKAPAWALLLSVGTVLAVHAGLQLARDEGGQIHSVAVTRLTNRGELRRSVEKTLALKELARDEHDLFSRDTVRRLMEFGQAVTTDAGWKDPEAWVTIETHSGSLVQSSTIRPIDLDARSPYFEFTLPTPVDGKDVAVIRLVSNLVIAKVLDAPIDEETIRRSDDPFRAWTRVWHGRIFSLALKGPRSPEWKPALVRLGGGMAGALWALAALLTLPRRESSLSLVTPPPDGSRPTGPP